MRDDHGIDDRETEARASAVAAATGIRPVEGFEDPPPVLGPQPRAMVDNRELRGAVLRADRDLDGRRARRMDQRVAYQVADHLTKARVAASYDDGCRGLQCDLASRRDRPGVGRGVTRDRLQVARSRLPR